MRSWRARLAVAAVVVVTLAASALSWRWFVEPGDTLRWRPDLPERWSGSHPPADAVVMLGGAGPRFEAAVGLVEAGVAPTLVVSDPNDSPAGGLTPFEQFCQGSEPFERICFDPQPRTTRGESRFVADLAVRRGWDRLVLVTTPDQARRARLLLDRCWSGAVEVVVVDSQHNTMARIAYEWAATARSVLVRRSC
ncbi:MAG: YdcF family protein [Acidimicrobiales bacterium]